MTSSIAFTLDRLKEMYRTTREIEKFMNEPVSGNGMQTRRENIKNFLFNYRKDIYRAAELLEYQECEIQDLREMNTALHAALAETDANRAEKEPAKASSSVSESAGRKGKVKTAVVPAMPPEEVPEEGISAWQE